MARSSMAGAELQFTSIQLSEGAEVYTTGLTPAIDTAVGRSGAASYKFPGTVSAAPSVVLLLDGTVSTSPCYTRAWLMLDAYPSSEKTICGIGEGQSPNFTVRITSAGILRLYAQAANTQIGADSADTIPLSTWFRVELFTDYGTSGVGNTSITARYGFEGTDSVELASTTTASISFSASGLGFRCGWDQAPGVTANLWADDIVANTSSAAWGTANTAWPPPDGRLALLLPARLIAAGNWTTNKTGAPATEAEIVDALDNTPPLGVADSTSNATSTQVRCGTAASTGTPNYLELETRSYGRAGIPGPLLLTTAGGTYQVVGDASARTRASQRIYICDDLDFAYLHLSKVGTPTDNLEIAVQADSAGVPSGTDLAVAVVAGASLTTTSDWVALDLRAVTAARSPYHLVLRRSAAVDASNHYRAQLTTASAYYDGGVNLWGGASWGTIDRTKAAMLRAYNGSGFATIYALYPICHHGEGTATGTKTGVVNLTAPAASTDITFTVGDDVGTAGTFATNWRKVRGAAAGGLDRPPVPSMAAAARIRVGKTDTGTRFVLVCMLAVLAEYASPQPGWLPYTKTSDASAWWGKFTSRPTQYTTYPAGVETDNVVEAGQYVLVADPLPADGVLASVTVVDDAALKAGYTLA